MFSNSMYFLSSHNCEFAVKEKIQKILSLIVLLCRSSSSGYQGLNLKEEMQV